MRAWGSLPPATRAGPGKWKSIYNDFLIGAKVTIVADRDEPGRAHARQVAEALDGVAGEVDIVECPKGKDISAHLAAGGSIAEASSRSPTRGYCQLPAAKGLAPGNPRYEGRRLDMAGLLAAPDEPTPWRCQGVAADGYLTTIAGRGGEGKSWLTLALAHGVHRGAIVAGIACTKGKAVIFDAENGAELLKRRFRAAGIRPPSVQPYDVDGLHILKDLDWFKSEIESEGAKLVIFDSLRILSSGADENDTEQVEPIMSALRRLAREMEAAIILVHHRGRDENSSYRGSSAIRDGTDMLFKLGRVKEDPEARHRRALETVKCRIDEEPGPRWLRIDSTRCGEVSAFRQWSTSSTTLAESSRISGARSRSDTCRTSGVCSKHDRSLHVRPARDGGEDDQVAGPDELLRAVVHGDRAAGARALQVAAEAGRAVGGEVVDPDLVEGPAGAGEERVDVAGDEARRPRTRRGSGGAGRG